MAIKHGATERNALFPILEQQDKTLEQIADEVLEKSWEMYRKKAKFAVVTQAHTILGDATRHFAPGDPARRSGVLDVFSTRLQAEAALASVIAPRGTKWATAWAVPVHHEKPAEFWKAVESIANVDAPNKPATRAEKFVEHLAGRLAPPADLCEAMFVNSDHAVQRCFLSRLHDGPHEGFTGDGNGAPLNNPRRLAGLPILEEEINESHQLQEGESSGVA